MSGSLLFSNELIDELVAGRDARTVFEKDGLLDKLTIAIADRFPNARTRPETKARRVEAPISPIPDAPERMLNEALGLARDIVDPIDALIASYRNRFEGFDERVIALYARGGTAKEIQLRLGDLYGVPMPEGLIERLTGEFEASARAWRSRPLEPMYPIVFFESVRVKVLEGGAVRNKLVHLALAIHPDGAKEVIGLWTDTAGGAAFWRGVMEDLRRRGVEDVLFFVHSAKEECAAIAAVFPDVVLQTRIVHLIRASLEFTSSQTRAAVLAALRGIYGAGSEAEANLALDALSLGEWGQKYPAIAALWRRAWDCVVAFLNLPADVRRVISTTYAIEILHTSMRRAIKLRGHFAGDEEALSLMYLVVREGQKNWKRPQKEWHAAKTQFALLYPERFTTRLS